MSHVWGKQTFNTGDLSRNNWPIGILAFGEGWHNNHHAFEFSARHGLEWWQAGPYNRPSFSSTLSAKPLEAVPQRCLNRSNFSPKGAAAKPQR